ncbi:MAG TPA: cyanophycinase [Clostridia bacterium]|nr:cyanophycinase [Clostridia bacterium]
MGQKVKGNLVIIGGKEDKYGERDILKQVVGIAGGDKADLIVMTTATEKPQEVGDEYRRVFQGLGVNEIKIMNINSREDANIDFNAETVEKATGIFFTGGDQLRITSILGGTKIYSALQRAFENGCVIAGTSAGASAMSDTMIVDGKSNDPARKCTLKMAPGLGLLKETIIDQHFDQRGRTGRLLCGVAENPYVLGIGIDEDTAIRVFPDAHFEVIGTNAVTVIDGRSIKSSNVSELQPDEILAINNVTLHVLPRKYGFNMESREVIRID